MSASTVTVAASEEGSLSSVLADCAAVGVAVIERSLRMFRNSSDRQCWVGNRHVGKQGFDVLGDTKRKLLLGRTAEEMDAVKPVKTVPLFPGMAFLEGGGRHCCF